MAIQWKGGDRFRIKSLQELTREGWTLCSGSVIPPHGSNLLPLAVIDTAEEIEIVSVGICSNTYVYHYNIIRLSDGYAIEKSMNTYEMQYYLDRVVVQPPAAQLAPTPPDPNLAWIATSLDQQKASQWDTWKPAPTRCCTCEFYMLMREGCKCGGFKAEQEAKEKV